MGTVEVTVPRLRKTAFESKVLPKYARRTEEIDEMIIEAYVRGCSTRNMSAITKALMGEKVSRSSVSRITNHLEETVENLRNKKLTRRYPYLFLDTTYIPCRWARSVEIGAEESTESWKRLLDQLIARGLKGVDLVISDRNQGIRKPFHTGRPPPLLT